MKASLSQSAGSFGASETRLLSGYLKSTDLRKVWEKSHWYSDKKNSPENYGQEVKVRPLDINILTYIDKIIDIQIKASSRLKPQDLDLNKRLQVLKEATWEQLRRSRQDLISFHLDHPSLDAYALSQNVELTKHQSSFLKVLDRDLTSSKNYNPLRDVYEVISIGAKHIIHELKESPASCAFFSIPAITSFLVINSRVMKTGYMDKERCAFDGFDIEDPDYDLLLENVDKLDDPDFINQCSNSFKHREDQALLRIDNETAEMLENMPIIGYFYDKIFPEKGIRIDTIVDDVMSPFDAVNDFLTAKNDLVMGDAMQRVGDVIMPDNSFRQKFKEGAEVTKEVWQSYDYIENNTIHPPMFIGAALAAYKHGTMTDEELSELYESIKNNIRYVLTETPLTAAFGVAGGGAAGYGADGNFAMGLWVGVASACIGQYVHHKNRRSKILDKLTAHLKEIDEVIAELIDSNSRVGTEFNRPKDALKDMLQSPKFLMSAAVVTALLAADFQLNNGNSTAFGLGGAASTAMFWLMNAVQEAKFHFIMIGGGLVTGKGCAMLKNMCMSAMSQKPILEVEDLKESRVMEISGGKAVQMKKELKQSSRTAEREAPHLSAHLNAQDNWRLVYG